MGRLLMSPCCERISPYDHAAAEGNLKMFTFAENGKRSEQSMEKETALPKNIRQMGDVHGKEKIYMEDYVMTYIRKKEQQGENGSIGILLGERHETMEGTYIFVRGIYEVPWEEENKRCANTREEIKEAQQENTEDKGNKESKENNADAQTKKTESMQEQTERKSEEECIEKPPLTLKERLHKGRIEYFPGWDVEGCCVIGKYSPELLERLFEILPGTRQLIFHLQEQEETVYWRNESEYRRIHGYFVFYEQNRKMQEYLSDVFGASTVEQENTSERAIKNFREKIREKSEQKAGSMLKLASSFFVITVLVAGAVAVNRIDEIRKVRNVTNMSSKEPNGQRDLEYTKERMLALQESEDTVQKEAEAQEASAQYTADLQSADIQEEADLQNVDIQEKADIQEEADLQNVDIQEKADLQSGDMQAEADQQSGDAADTADTQTQGVQETQVQDGSRQNPGGQETQVQDENAAWMAGSDGFWEDEETDARLQESAQETAARSAQASYVIRPGDTLADICKQYYGSIEQLAHLCEVNNISDANKIMPGQKIVLP